MLIFYSIVYSTKKVLFIVDFFLRLSYKQEVKSDGASLPLIAPDGRAVGGNFLRAFYEDAPVGLVPKECIMTKPGSTSAVNDTIGLSDRQGDPFRYNPATTTISEPCQRVITSAILTTTAFRLRDDAALIEALRLLIQAVKPFEESADLSSADSGAEQNSKGE